MTSNPDAWPPEHIELLTALWPKGEAASAIASKLKAAFPGCGYSRSAILGKIHRLKLAASGREMPARPARLPKVRPEPRATRAALKAPPVARAPHQNAGLSFKTRKFGIAGQGAVFEEAPARPARAVIPFREEGPGLRTVMTVGAQECRWPLGDPGEDDFTFCGQRSANGSYCAGHAARAVAAPQPGRPTTAHALARSLRRYL